MIATVRLEGGGASQIEFCISLDTLALQMHFMESMRSVLTMVQSRIEIDADVDSDEKVSLTQRLQQKQAEIHSLKCHAYAMQKSKSKEGRAKCFRLVSLQEIEQEFEALQSHMQANEQLEKKAIVSENQKEAPEPSSSSSSPSSSWGLASAITSVSYRLTKTLERARHKKVQPEQDDHDVQMNFHSILNSNSDSWNPQVWVRTTFF